MDPWASYHRLGHLATPQLLAASVVILVPQAAGASLAAAAKVVAAAKVTIQAAVAMDMLRAADKANLEEAAELEQAVMTKAKTQKAEAAMAALAGVGRRLHLELTQLAQKTLERLIQLAPAWAAPKHWERLEVEPKHQTMRLLYLSHQLYLHGCDSYFGFYGLEAGSHRGPISTSNRVCVRPTILYDWNCCRSNPNRSGHN